MLKKGIALTVTLFPVFASGADSGTSDHTAGPTISGNTLTSVPMSVDMESINERALPAPTQVQAAGMTGSSISGAGGYSEPITFSEYPEGTNVTTSYQERGIHFGGAGPTIVTDDANPGGRALSGGDEFMGEISGRFVLPGTNIPAPVYHFGFDIGHIESSNAVKLEFYGGSGQRIFEAYAPSPGYFRLNNVGGNIGIHSWRAFIVGSEPQGFGIDNVYFSKPGVRDDRDLEQGEGCPAAGNPVTPSTGNKFQEEVDYRGNRPFPLEVRRAYNSLDGAWRFFPEVVHDGRSVAVQVFRQNGKGITFLGWGLFGGRNLTPSSPNITGRLFAVAGGWRYETLDDIIDEYDAAGRILSRTNRAGISHTYTYDTGTITVTHSMGGSITYDVGVNGEVFGFEDPAGNNYQYGYNNDGMLQSIGYPQNSSSRLYHYEDANYPDLLTGITDARGNRFATWTYDAARRAISSAHHGDADLTNFDYSRAEETLPRITVTNALGKQTTYEYVVANGQRVVWDVEGHASENCIAANQSYRYDASLYIRSKQDWEGNLTTYLRDSRGRELTRTEAVGTSAERAYHTIWHPDFNVPLRRLEPGRTIEYGYDTDGNLLSTEATATPLN